jgi:hypothetical protein
MQASSDASSLSVVWLCHGDEPQLAFITFTTNIVIQKSLFPKESQAHMLTNDTVGWVEENTTKGPVAQPDPRQRRLQGTPPKGRGFLSTRY